MKNREVWICECPGSACMYGDDLECVAYGEPSAPYRCRQCGAFPVKHDISETRLKLDRCEALRERLAGGTNPYHRTIGNLLAEALGADKAPPTD